MKYFSESLPRQVLHGHSGRVNCLLYPVNDSPRYDPDHLVSGGMDFTVVLWDISNGTKLHTFSVHGGEIMQLIVPPENCNVSMHTRLVKEFSFLMAYFHCQIRIRTPTFIPVLCRIFSLVQVRTLIP